MGPGKRGQAATPKKSCRGCGPRGAVLRETAGKMVEGVGGSSPSLNLASNAGAPDFRRRGKQGPGWGWRQRWGGAAGGTPRSLWGKGGIKKFFGAQREKGGAGGGAPERGGFGGERGKKREEGIFKNFFSLFFFKIGLNDLGL